MKPSPGDAVLYAVSSTRTASWQAFTNAVDATVPPGYQPTSEMKYVRWEAVALGDSLAHWDTVADDQGIQWICVAPPTLARLPWPGLPRAVMCGSRSPDTALAVRAVAGSHDVRVSAAPQNTHHTWAPTRIALTARSDDDLAAVADGLGIVYRSEPPAWALAVACGSVAEYIDSLQWQPDDDLQWPRRDFDPGRLAFGPATRGDGRLRLSAYVHPSGWRRFDRLWRDGHVAVADRSWARYAVLASAGIRVLRYDHRAGTVAVPRQVPLPRLFARALALCSGPPLLGHTGATGSWMWHVPDLGIVVAGTVDQSSAIAVPFRLVPRALSALA